MSEKENVITHTYDLLKYLVPQLAKYPRQQKFLLADRIQLKVMEILDLFIEAYYSSSPQEKAALLRRVNLQLEKLRYLIRLSNDLRCINEDRYAYISRQVNDIGKQAGGWLKSLAA
ncbi:MAG: diversity-generating retroelement protein Avd [Lewinellaceae bacterium]|nr:diversity-generating retroelement protein Avd [Phaeodactylibacter sp.]MCB9036905.1 diversity-generating retroelement protein Avd [Lewinellaceae bacterium]